MTLIGGRKIAFTKRAAGVSPMRGLLGVSATCFVASACSRCSGMGERCGPGRVGGAVSMDFTSRLSRKDCAVIDLTNVTALQGEHYCWYKIQMQIARFPYSL